MQLTYYLNKNDSRYMDKKLLQIPASEGHPNPVTITLLENTSIVYPTFKMRDKDAYLYSNYCYVDDLRRYYFIDEITFSNGYAYLKCTCDVLSTYKEGIRGQNVILNRQEKVWDKYQNDGRLPVEQRMAKRCIGQFKSPFSISTNAYVLGVVGNVEGGE